MAKAVFLGLVLLAAGCQSEKGSLFYRKPDRPDDPMYSIEEQQRRGRERLSTIEDAGDLAPKAYIDRPGTLGR
ncbi:MAG: hypothetical protein ACJ8C4_02715 [Gemmataceae bacterium]